MTTFTSFRPEGVPHPFAVWLNNGETLLVSGLGGHRPDGSIDDDAAGQARQAMQTLRAHLDSAGYSIDEVVWVHPYVTELEHAAALDAEFRAAFGDAPPACGAMLAGVQLADPRMKLELEAVAVKGATRIRHP